MDATEHCIGTCCYTSKLPSTTSEGEGIGTKNATKSSTGSKDRVTQLRVCVQLNGFTNKQANSPTGVARLPGSQATSCLVFTCSLVHYYQRRSEEVF